MAVYRSLISNLGGLVIGKYAQVELIETDVL